MGAKRELLFAPTKINGITSKNRIAMAPVGTAFCGTRTGEVTDQLLCYYAARAKGGVGLIIVEHTLCTYKHWKGSRFLGFHTHDNLFGMRQLSETIHAFGTKVVVQLSLGLGRSTTTRATQCELVAPSPLPFKVRRGSVPRGLKMFEGLKGELPRELMIDEIIELGKEFVRAVERTKKAGFDGVEIHAAHGYLIAQFLSPLSNRRRDDYGGTFERRMTLLTNLIKQSREAVSRKFIIGVRISGDEHVKGGYTLDDAIKIAQAAENAGADYIHLSSGRIEALKNLYPNQEGMILREAEAIKKEVCIPVICPNIHGPVLAEEALSKGQSDMISLGRALIADPFWANKVHDGNESLIKRCIFCGTCYKSLYQGFTLKCKVNPEVGWERFIPLYHPYPVKNIVFPLLHHPALGQ